MDHVVYLDYKAKELENLQTGNKTMIIRGATGRKMPYDRVNEGDVLYFIENKGDGLVKAKAIAKTLFQSEKLTKEESLKIVENNQEFLQLDSKLKARFGGKRYLILITVKGFETLETFKIDRSAYANMDDWLLVENIEKVKEV